MPRGAPRIRTIEGKLNQLAGRVSARRHELHLGQEDLCGRIARLTDGMWNPTWRDVQRIERGQRIVSDIELLFLARALDCSPCWLLTGQQ